MRRFSRRSLLRSIGVAGLGWAGTSINSPLRGWSTEGKPPDSVKPLVAGSPFDVSMVDIAASAGLHAVGVCGEEDRKHWIIETTGCGITFFDYDDDGWLDIFMVNATTLKGFPKGEEPTNHMYHNNRDGNL